MLFKKLRDIYRVQIYTLKKGEKINKIDQIYIMYKSVHRYFLKNGKKRKGEIFMTDTKNIDKIYILWYLLQERNEVRNR